MQQSNESESTGRLAGWLIVILVSALIIAWGLLSFLAVGNPPRTWHFGVLPDAPGQSIYSTQETPESASPPRQIPPLPEAQPKKEAASQP